MGLRDTFKGAAGTVFTAFGDVAVSCAYMANGSSTYDASAGNFSVTSTRHMVSMIFTDYTNYEQNNDRIQPNDIKALIPQNNLTPVPKLTDSIIRVEAGASVEYEIVNIETDPADALWTFQIRSR